MAYTIGMNDAAHEISKVASSPIGQYTTSLLIKGEASERRVFVLRNFDKGILIGDAGRKKVIFFPWTEVSHVADLATPPRKSTTKDIACALIARFCSD